VSGRDLRRNGSFGLAVLLGGVLLGAAAQGRDSDSAGHRPARDISETGAPRPPSEQARGMGEVRAVRHWSYPGFSRVWIELSRPAVPRVNYLAADPKAGRPERLYLDLDGVWIGREHTEPIRVGDGLLEGVRLGQNTPSTTRVVIDLQRYQRHRLLSLQGPDRVVIDVFGPGAAPPEGGSRESAAAPETTRALREPSPPQEAPSPAKPLPFEFRPVRTVVLDPGHGGRDPGAIGVGGLEEKDVTLRLALELRKRLRERGFRVVMTRDEDRTLDLEERTAIAEGAGGDVFVSLHCNAAPRPSLHGIETYSLNESDEQHSVQVAARENGIAQEEVDVLQRTVAQLRVSEASGPSWILAELVHHQLVQGLRERYDAVNDLGVKKGPFYVLFLSSMPSILVESGFLTHRDEAKRLHSRAYVTRLAESMAEGLALYRERAHPMIARSAR
jgi:N-acetylmuramoyl-L-alanine amidase